MCDPRPATAQNLLRDPLSLNLIMGAVASIVQISQIYSSQTLSLEQVSDTLEKQKNEQSVDCGVEAQKPLAIEIEQINKIDLIYFPFYYMEDVKIDKFDIVSARTSWGHILDNSAVNFVNLSPEQRNKYPTCLHWFSNSFYERFFEKLPHSRKQFGERNMQCQGFAMVKMITGCVTKLSSLSRHAGREEWKQSLQTLAKDHTNKGVVHTQYGIMGEVLFWTLDICLGPQFNVNTWLKVYSLMLKYIIPSAVSAERQKLALKAHINYEEEEKHFHRSRCNSYDPTLSDDTIVTPVGSPLHRLKPQRFTT